MKFILLSLAVSVFAVNVYGRCNGGYANHILEQRYTGCSSNESFLNEVTSIDGYYAAISGVCMDGCYSALFNPDLRSECDRKYQNALAGFSGQISAAAQRFSCNDQGPQNSRDQQSSRSIDTNCSWLTRTSTQITCGGGPANQNMCGAGGKAVCAGEILCYGESDLGGATVPPGGHRISCLSNSESCDSVTISACASDSHTLPSAPVYYDSTLAPTVNRQRDAATRSVR